MQNAMSSNGVNAISLSSFQNTAFMVFGMLTFQLAKQMISHLYERKFSRYWINRSMNKVLRSSTESISKLGAGATNQLAVNETNSIAGYFTEGIGNVLGSSILILISAIMLFYLIPTFTIVLVVVLGIGIPFGLKMLSYGKNLMKHSAETWAAFNSVSTDIVSSHLQIRSLGIEDAMLSNLRKKLSISLSVNLRAHWRVTLIIIVFFAYILLSITLLNNIASHLNLLRDIRAESAFAFFGYLILLLSRVTSFSSTVASLQGFKAKKERLTDLLNLPEDADWNLVPKTDITSLGYTNLSVGYGSNVLFSGLTGEISAGSILLVKGPSGCGKSTFLRTLYGIHESQDGKILLNGEEIQGLRSLGLNAALLPQEIRFYSGSLKWNVELLAGRVVSNDELELILSEMKLMDRLGEHIDFSTDLREAGANLSGGEKQRLSLACMVLRDPKVLLLDEPTSQIDPASERIFLKGLKSLAAKGCIIVLVAHKGMAESVATSILDFDSISIT